MHSSQIYMYIVLTVHCNNYVARAAQAVKVGLKPQHFLSLEGIAPPYFRIHHVSDSASASTKASTDLRSRPPYDHSPMHGITGWLGKVLSASKPGTSERSFSSHCLLKNDYHESKLYDLMLLYTHRDRAIDLRMALTEFIRSNTEFLFEYMHAYCFCLRSVLR